MILTVTGDVRTGAFDEILADGVWNLVDGPDSVVLEAVAPPVNPAIFVDLFESGDPGVWSATSP